MSPLVVIKTFSSVLDARVAQSQLQAAGIPAYLPDENLASIDPLLLDAIGGVRLQVRERDQEEALSLLEQPVVDEPLADDEPTCPRCDSPYWSRRWSGRERLVIIASLGLPLLFWKQRLVCHRCDHQFTSPAPAVGSNYRELATTTRRPGNPVFFLRRHRALGGAAVGFMVGLLASVLTGASMALPTGVLLGVLLGWRSTYEVCSVPSCRASLRLGQRTCPKCKGTLGRVITSEAEHWIYKAAWHREPAPGPPRS